MAGGLKNSRWAARDPKDARDVRASSVPAPLIRSHTTGTIPKSGAASEKSEKFEKSEKSGNTQQLQQLQKSAGSAAAELSRYSKIVRRMKWKLPFLDLAYRQATADHHMLDAASKLEAELMFKLDFFDYYMLCERALVHLQGVFGITILRDSTTHNTKAIKKNGRYPHSYHANVLGALDNKDNPLHAVLGVGDVRWHLARAKDLRNHWKNADDSAPKTPATAGAAGTAGTTGKTDTRSDKAARAAAAAPLSSYNLAGILTSIHQGLDQAYIVASEFVASCAGRPDSDDALAAHQMVLDTAADADDDDEWGFMVDAMDWEAV